MANMTVKQVIDNGYSREASLIGVWNGPNGEFAIRAEASDGGVMKLLFCVGSVNQEIGIPDQLRIESAIKAGLFTRK